MKYELIAYASDDIVYDALHLIFSVPFYSAVSDYATGARVFMFKLKSLINLRYFK